MRSIVIPIAPRHALTSPLSLSLLRGVLCAGDITVLLSAADDDAEKMDGLFSIELNTRIYILRAPSDEDAAQWVAVLNKIKAEGAVASGRVSRTTSPSPSLSQASSASTSRMHSMDISATEGDEGGALQQGEKVRSPSEGNADWLKSGRRWHLCCCP